MRVTLERSDLLKSLNHVHRVVERRNTIPILSNVLLKADGTTLQMKATDLDLEITETTTGQVDQAGATTVPAHLLYDIVRKLPEGAEVQLSTNGENTAMAVTSGRSKFSLQCLPEADFPDLTAGTFSHTFRLPAAQVKMLIDRTQFAISTEETRYYLNGIFLHTIETDGKLKLRAVATDGHRLARADVEAPSGSEGMPGIIVPRKTVGELQKLVDDPDATVTIEVSDAKIRLTIGGVVMTSKLIDGTFPDYQRVIPTANDKKMTIDCESFAAGGRPCLHDLVGARPGGQALDRGRPTHPDGAQSGFGKRNGGTARGLRERSAGDRLQCQVPARHHEPALRFRCGLHAGRSGIAHARARHGRRRRALRSDADAGVTRGPAREAPGIAGAE